MLAPSPRLVGGPGCHPPAQLVSHLTGTKQTKSQKPKAKLQNQILSLGLELESARASRRSAVSIQC